MITKAKILNIHWDEKEVPVYEASIEVEHSDGTIQLFVVPILHVTERIIRDYPNTDTNRGRAKASGIGPKKSRRKG